MKEEVKQTICHFWTYEANRPNGDKKDIVRKRVGPKQYLKHTKQVLRQTQSEAFFNFRSEHPEIIISPHKFEHLKPYFVKGATERDRRSCLYRTHEEAKLVLSECIEFRKNVLKEVNHADNPPVSLSVTEAVELTLCPKPEGNKFRKFCCINRERDNCGTLLFRLLPEESSERGMVKWRRFES